MKIRTSLLSEGKRQNNNLCRDGTILGGSFRYETSIEDSTKNLKEKRNNNRIRTGSAYEASLTFVEDATSALSLSSSELDWDPSYLNDRDLQFFLEKSKYHQGIDARDIRLVSEEGALSILKNCNYNVGIALNEMLNNNTFWCAGDLTYYQWSDIDIQLFEQSMMIHYKDFNKIATLMRSRGSSKSMKDVVQYYYTWKNSERFDGWFKNYSLISDRVVETPPSSPNFDVEDNIEITSLKRKRSESFDDENSSALKKKKRK